MPDRELVLRTKCEHGGMGAHLVGDVSLGVDLPECPGGSETVLDPEQVVFRAWDNHYQQYSITVQDVLDALGGSDE